MKMRRHLSWKWIKVFALAAFCCRFYFFRKNPQIFYFPNKIRHIRYVDEDKEGGMLCAHGK